MKKRFYVSMILGLLLVVATYVLSFATEVKIAQVPIPWQFWGLTVDGQDNYTVIDRIRISPTYYEPIGDEPPGADVPIFVQRQVAVSPTFVFSLDSLVWNFNEGGDNTPMIDLEWEQYDAIPQLVEPGMDLELEIPIGQFFDGAVLVAYEVFADGTGDPIAHFINQAVIQTTNPSEIVEIMVNFDIHNDTGFDVTNFELDFLGLNFGEEDVLGSIGYKAATGWPVPVPLMPEIWGMPIGVSPIAGGTEVTWLELDNPLATSEWLHLGLVLDCTGFDCFNTDTLGATVQGYWTTTVPEPSTILLLGAGLAGLGLLRRRLKN